MSTATAEWAIKRTAAVIIGRNIGWLAASTGCTMYASLQAVQLCNGANEIVAGPHSTRFCDPDSPRLQSHQKIRFCAGGESESESSVRTERSGWTGFYYKTHLISKFSFDNLLPRQEEHVAIIRRVIMDGRILGRKLARELPMNELDAVAGAATLTSTPNNVGPSGGDSQDTDDTGGSGGER